MVNSLTAGASATAIALVLGTLAAIAVHRYRFFGRETISFLLVLPIALPGVVTGIALQRTFKTFDLDLGIQTVIVGHATFCVVIVFNNVIARLRRLPASPEEASGDLGADMLATFRRITAPAARDGAALGGAARVRAVVRRDHRHELHGRAGDPDGPALDLLRDPAAERAARS